MRDHAAPEQVLDPPRRDAVELLDRERAVLRGGELGHGVRGE
jgi:hypothetical protein